MPWLASAGLVLALMLLVGVLLRLRRIEPATIDQTPLGRASNGLLATMGVLFVSAGVGVIQEVGPLPQ